MPMCVYSSLTAFTSTEKTLWTS